MMITTRNKRDAHRLVCEDETVELLAMSKHEAELEVRVMETRTWMLGAEHPDTLSSRANRASTYRK